MGGCSSVTGDCSHSYCRISTDATNNLKILDHSSVKLLKFEKERLSHFLSPPPQRDKVKGVQVSHWKFLLQDQDHSFTLFFSLHKSDTIFLVILVLSINGGTLF
jgi:hypothetical protein